MDMLRAMHYLDLYHSSNGGQVTGTVLPTTSSRYLFTPKSYCR